MTNEITRWWENKQEARTTNLGIDSRSPTPPPPPYRVSCHVSSHVNSIKSGLLCHSFPSSKKRGTYGSYTTNDLHRGRVESQTAKTLICRFIVPYFTVCNPCLDVSYYSNSLHVKGIDVRAALRKLSLLVKSQKFWCERFLVLDHFVYTRVWAIKYADMPCSHAHLTYITRTKHREGKNRVNRSKISL